jgi:hypothetical protein
LPGFAGLGLLRILAGNQRRMQKGRFRLRGAALRVTGRGIGFSFQDEAFAARVVHRYGLYRRVFQFANTVTSYENRLDIEPTGGCGVRWVVPHCCGFEFVENGRADAC